MGLSYSVWNVFNNFLLIDATDRSKISSEQKHFFIALSLYPLSFFANTPFEEGPPYIIMKSLYRIIDVLYIKYILNFILLTSKSSISQLVLIVSLNSAYFHFDRSYFLVAAASLQYTLYSCNIPNYKKTSSLQYTSWLQHSSPTKYLIASALST